MSENGSDMVMETPDWDDVDLAICRKYDELVTSGQMSYRRIR